MRGFAGYKIIGGKQVPKFRFGLISETDATADDEQYLDGYGKQQLRTGLSPTKKVVMVRTTPELLDARRRAALNYRSLLLQTMRYGEITVAFRKHAGDFPLFTKYSVEDDVFIVCNVEGDTVVPRSPKQVITV